MVGSIRCTLDGTRHLLTLHEDRSWVVAPRIAGLGPVLEQASRSYGGPADGIFGPDALRDVEAYLRLRGATNVATKLPQASDRPTPPGFVY